jgi:hypothetical protein
MFVVHGVRLSDFPSIKPTSALLGLGIVMERCCNATALIYLIYMYPKLPISIAFNNCSARPTLPVQSDRDRSKPSDLPRHRRRKSKPPTADFLIFSVRIISNRANSVVDNEGKPATDRAFCSWIQRGKGGSWGQWRNAPSR